MSYPTRAIVPLLLDDFRKVGNDPKSEHIITQDMVIKCLQSVKTIQLHETLEVNGITIKSYYAGHVLGATIFYIAWDGLRVVYTGDFNTVGDRHLGAAVVDRLRPHMLLTETTYGTTVRDSKRSRERDFLKQVHTTIKRGGKVLIPVFALGRAQVCYSETMRGRSCAYCWRRTGGGRTSRRRSISRADSPRRLTSITASSSAGPTRRLRACS